jgi:hypothetical protein
VDEHCQAPGCWRLCEKTVRMVSDLGAHTVTHVCKRHYEQILAVATQRGIPVVDKRVIRHG